MPSIQTAITLVLVALAALWVIRRYAPRPPKGPGPKGTAKAGKGKCGPGPGCGCGCG